MEDKAKIARNFAQVLRMTRNYKDLRDLTYHQKDDEEFVLAEFANGHTKTINVHYDSGAAMLYDILRGLD